MQTKSLSNLFRATALVLLVASWGVSRAPAADEASLITVTATGRAEAKPDAAEIVLSSSGAGELAGDAIAKFRSAGKQTADAVQALGIKNLKLKEGGITLGSSQAAAGGNPFAAAVQQGQAAPKAQMSVAREVTVILTGIGKSSEEELLEALGKILDSAKDAGATPPTAEGNMMGNVMRAMLAGGGGNSAVTYVVNNPSALRKAAYKSAFDQAKARATELAALAGKELGDVVTIKEGAGGQNGELVEAQMEMVRNMYGAGSGGGKTDERLTSNKFAPIALNATLTVAFRLK